MNLREKYIVASTVRYGRGRGEETFLLKKGYLGNFVKGKGGI